MIGALIDFDTFVIAYLIVFLIYAFVKLIKNRKMGRSKIIKLILKNFIFVGYFVCLAGITLAPISIPPEQSSVELKSLIVLDPLKMFDYPYVSIAIRNIAGNVLMMVPLIPLYGIWKGHKTITMKQTFVFAFCVSLSIEFLQLIENITGLSGVMVRTLDISDIICNIIGAIVGFAIYKVYIKLFNSEK